MSKAESAITYPEGTPPENFSRGLYRVDLPAQFGEPVRGKVRDNWSISVKGERYRIMVTTDRQSALESAIGTTPGKGAVLNMLSAEWFRRTSDIIPNHCIAVPHPNLLIARDARATLPVEVVVRDYMAQSSTSTSVYSNYVKGRREIYGLPFPDGLIANEKLKETIVTPTTKAEHGHDEMLTSSEAEEIVDRKLGKGVWHEAQTAARALFSRGREQCAQNGLILVDTKYEFGLDSSDNLMLIDEVHTPDSSRFWLSETYEEKFSRGETPDTFDKEILRRWLAKQGFTGEGQVPVVAPDVFDQMTQAYGIAYKMITGRNVPNISSDPEKLQTQIVTSIEQFFNRLSKF